MFKMSRSENHHKLYSMLRTVLFIALWFLGFPAQSTLLTPNGNPTSGPTAKGSYGSSTLDPSPALYMIAGNCPWLDPALGKLGIKPDNGWTVERKALEGSITLNFYDPWADTQPSRTCYDITNGSNGTAKWGGAAICLQYTPKPGSSDPTGAALDWIQVIHTNQPSAYGVANGVSNGNYTDYIDNGWIGGTAINMNPFYSGQDNNAQTQYTANSTTFLDVPGRAYKPSADWEAQVFLATGDLPNKKLTIYDGVWWGFYTVPEPSIFALLGLGGIVLVVAQRKNTRG